MRNVFLFIIFVWSGIAVEATVLEIGVGKPFTRLQQAASQAKPGDTLLIREGVYPGGDYIEKLQGTVQNYIVIRAAKGEQVIFRGGSQAFHLTDPAYLKIEGLIFEQQTSNGVNIDDGGSYDTPAHHIVISNCEWRSMNATGNNDELKMSGVDSFTITRCRFVNGSPGGSLIDMVGCHYGIFSDNYFENGGSNCIQAKGGTANILITRNRFINGGERAVNIGGSTGLQFFRPLETKYEAAFIRVVSNIFIGSNAPIAFVGAVQCEVANNTIHRPVRWAVRILQETVGNGFLPCGNNSFHDNIIVFSSAQPAFNIGGNTAPETFSYGWNLWYNPDNVSWAGPNIPADDKDPARIIADPLFIDTMNFIPSSLSPAIGSGSPEIADYSDFNGRQFSTISAMGRNRSRGAVEVYSTSSSSDYFEKTSIFYPNPTSGEVFCALSHGIIMPYVTLTHSVNGNSFLLPVLWRENGISFHCMSIPAGTYFVQSGQNILGKIVLIR